MYAAIRQGKAKTGMAEELTRRIKEGAIPIISDVPGFRANDVVGRLFNDTVTAISIFNDYAGAEESEGYVRLRGSTESCALAHRASYSVGGAGDREHLGVARNGWGQKISNLDATGITATVGGRVQRAPTQE